MQTLNRAGLEGLSPRVRGNPSRYLLNLDFQRSIPARAGEPTVNVCCADSLWVYPRACGGTCLQQPQRMTIGGLSPRVRGNLLSQALNGVAERSIPARAGEPPRWFQCVRIVAVYPRACGGTGVVALRRARL